MVLILNMKKILLIFVIVSIAGGVMLFFVNRDETNVTPGVLKIKEIANKSLCSLKGGEWVSCGYGRFGPCGCKKMYKDGGNLCQDGKDCISGVCSITNSDIPDAN